jgi:UDP-2,3-diacylglucosamine hydrolase
MESPRTIFASDFHLSLAESTKGVAQFCAFIEQEVQGAAAFHILGDLFDYWIGKSMLGEKALQPAFEAMQSLTRAGTTIHWIPGNRDFLLSQGQALSFGAIRGGDWAELTQDGQRLCLTHGDLFCTFDKKYQRMRRILHSPIVRGLAAVLPGFITNRIALRLRRHSMRVVKKKTAHETSIDEKQVQQCIAKGFTAVLCGHVHQERDQVLPGGGRLITLSDWHDRGGYYAEMGPEGLSLKHFSV